MCSTSTVSPFAVTVVFHPVKDAEIRFVSSPDRYVCECLLHKTNKQTKNEKQQLQL